MQSLSHDTLVRHTATMRSTLVIFARVYRPRALPRLFRGMSASPAVPLIPVDAHVSLRTKSGREIQFPAWKFPGVGPADLAAWQNTIIAASDEYARLSFDQCVACLLTVVHQMQCAECGCCRSVGRRVV